MIRETLTRIRFMFFRKSPAEVDDEMWFHIEAATGANVAAGMTAAEARRQALIEFGGVERTREQTFEQRPGW